MNTIQPAVYLNLSNLLVPKAILQITCLKHQYLIFWQYSLPSSFQETVMTAMTIIFMLVLLEDCRTVSQLDSSPTNTSPRTDPQLTFPDRHLPNGDIPDWTIPRLDTSVMETSPNEHFPIKKFPQP